MSVDISAGVIRPTSLSFINVLFVLNGIDVDMSTDMSADSVSRYSVEGVLNNSHMILYMYSE